MDLGALVGLIIVVVFFVLITLAVVWLSRIRTVGPNQVLIISGRLRKQVDAQSGQPTERTYRIVKAGRAFIWPVIEQVDMLSLELLTIDVNIDDVYTIQGVPISLDGVAQIKIASDDVSIQTAAERFLSKTRAELEAVAHETMAGHLRAIVGTLTVEEIYRERDKFAQSVQEVSAEDLKNMGLSIDTFVIKDIRDKEGYLDALGRPRIAEVKRQAVVAEQVAAAEEEAARRDFGIKKAEYDREVRREQAQSDLAYQLQTNITNQQVREQEVQVEIVSKRKQIEMQEQEASRMARELEATVRRPAEAEQFRIQTIADARKFEVEAQATAEAEAIRLKGEAEADAVKARGLAQAEVIRQQGLAQADVIRQQGLAEAEAMERKAAAWQEYTQAAIVQQLVEALPGIASAIAQPLSRTESIVVIGSGENGAGASKVTADVTNIMTQLPVILQALTGVDLVKTLQNLPGVVTAKGGRHNDSAQSGGSVDEPGTVDAPPAA